MMTMTWPRDSECHGIYDDIDTRMNAISRKVALKFSTNGMNWQTNQCNSFDSRLGLNQEASTRKKHEASIIIKRSEYTW